MNHVSVKLFHTLSGGRELCGFSVVVDSSITQPPPVANGLLAETGHSSERSKFLLPGTLPLEPVLVVHYFWFTGESLTMNHHYS